MRNLNNIKNLMKSLPLLIVALFLLGFGFVFMLVGLVDLLYALTGNNLLSVFHVLLYGKTTTQEGAKFYAILILGFGVICLIPGLLAWRNSKKIRKLSGMCHANH